MPERGPCPSVDNRFALDGYLALQDGALGVSLEYVSEETRNAVDANVRSTGVASDGTSQWTSGSRHARIPSRSHQLYAPRNRSTTSMLSLVGAIRCSPR